MPIADVKEYCKTHNIPMTSIRVSPSFNKEKNRVTKGQAIAHTGWNSKSRFEKNKTITTPGIETPATMWMMHLKTAKLYVIDIDVKGDKTAKDVLDSKIYDMLLSLSEYVIETGSKGLHFYFKLPDSFSGKVKNFINIGDTGFFKEGEEGSVDIIMDSIITEGSSYNFNNVTYKYINIKQGSSVSDINEWNGFTEFYNTFLIEEKMNKKELIMSYEELEKHLNNIPNDTRNWDRWYKMGQTIYNICGDSGCDLFKSWSSKSPIYNEKATIELWRGLSNNREKPLYIGTILYESKTANEQVYNLIRIEYAPLSYESIKSLIEQNHFFIEEPKPMYVRIKDTSLLYYKPMEMYELLKSYNYKTLVKDKEVDISFYTTWSKDNSKRCYKRIGLYPDSSKCPIDEFNGFFPCRASKLPMNMNKVDIKPILDHIAVLGNYDEKVIDFIIMGFAQMVQRPGDLPGILQLFYADEGAGKDLIIAWIGSKILGDHQYAFIGNIENLFNNFNAELNGKVLIHCDEVIKVSPKEAEMLKRMITSGRARLEKKGVDAELIKAWARLYLTTNHRDALNITVTDRRMFPVSSSNCKTKNMEYFSNLGKILEDDTVVRAFYDYLMTVDISMYNHLKRPDTQLYKDMKASSMDKVLLWILHSEDDVFSEKKSATEWLCQYNMWADMNKERKHNITSLGVAMKTLVNRNIGITHKKPNNRSEYEIKREEVIEYLKREGLYEADEE